MQQGAVRGQVIDLPLLDRLFSFIATEAAIYRLTGEVRERTGSRSETTSPRNVFRTKDGRYIGISASIQAMAERVFRAIGRADMLADSRFRTNTDRVRTAAACEAPIVEFIGARTLAENMEVFARAEVTAAPVYDPISGRVTTLFPARQLMLIYLTRWMREFHVDGIRMDSVENVANWEFIGGFKDLARSLWNQRWTEQGLGPGADQRFLVVGEELSLPLDLLRQRRLDGLWNGIHFIGLIDSHFIANFAAGNTENSRRECKRNSQNGKRCGCNESYVQPQGRAINVVKVTCQFAPHAFHVGVGRQ